MVKRFYYFVIAMFFALPAMADCVGINKATWKNQTPFLANVVGVASDDFLNLRQAPSASSQDVGDLEFNARRVEIVAVSADLKWGQTNSRESTGWVRLCYIEPITETYDGLGPLVCHGNEPFWSFDIQDQELTFKDIEGRELEVEMTTWKQSPNDIRDFGALSTWAGDATVTVSRQQCNDGMSDKQFGLKTMTFIRGDFYSGCCSLR